EARDRSAARGRPRAAASASASQRRQWSDSRPGRGHSAGPEIRAAAPARPLLAPRSSGFCLAFRLALLAQAHAGEDQRPREQHAERDTLTEQQPCPDDTEQRYQVSDRRGTRRTNAGDESVVEDERDACA